MKPIFYSKSSNFIKNFYYHFCNLKFMKESIKLLKVLFLEKHKVLEMNY